MDAGSYTCKSCLGPAAGTIVNDDSSTSLTIVNAELALKEDRTSFPIQFDLLRVRSPPEKTRALISGRHTLVSDM
jgi:hypothetical protein